MALMLAMFVDREELTTTAGFVLEMRDKPQWAVRVLNHDPIEFDDHIIYKVGIGEILNFVNGSEIFILLQVNGIFGIFRQNINQRWQNLLIPMAGLNMKTSSV